MTTGVTEPPEKPPVKWATIREDATERGLFAVVDEAMIGRKLAPSRRKLVVGNIVMAVAKWRETFRDCGCWKTADGYALCPWHERMLQSQVEPPSAASSLPSTPVRPDLTAEPLFRLGSVDMTEDSLGNLITDHLYEIHGINTRSGTPDAEAIATHVEDHGRGRSEASGEDIGTGVDHGPDEFYMGRWMTLVSEPRS